MITVVKLVRFVQLENSYRNELLILLHEMNDKKIRMSYGTSGFEYM